jgi:hypothetical protein
MKLWLLWGAAAALVMIWNVALWLRRPDPLTELSPVDSPTWWAERLPVWERYTRENMLQVTASERARAMARAEHQAPRQAPWQKVTRMPTRG